MIDLMDFRIQVTQTEIGKQEFWEREGYFNCDLLCKLKRLREIFLFQFPVT